MTETILNIDINELEINENLSKRTVNICQYSGLINLEKILLYQKENIDFKKLRNCGEKSNSELLNICEKYKDFNIIADNNKIINLNNNNTLSKIPIVEKIDNLTIRQKSILNNLLNINLNKLSVRSYNILTNYLGTKELKIRVLKKLVFTNKSFNLKELRNSGEKSIKEIRQFLNETQNIIETISIFENEEELNKEFINSFLMKHLGVSLKISSEISSLYTTIYGFPIFSAIKILVENDYVLKNKKEKLIFENMGFFNKPLKTLTEISEKINLSRERTRQIRNQILKNFNNYFSFIKTLNENNIHNTYSLNINDNILIIDDELVAKINKKENTNYNLIFINKIFAILYNNYSIVGNEDFIVLSKTLRFEHNWKRTYLINKETKSLFDFEKLVNDINRRLNDKIENDYQFHFHSYLINFQKANCIKKIDEIAEIAEYIIFNEFGIILNSDENIVFKKNTHKGVTDYIYEILIEANKPLTVSDIYNKINDKYPNATKSKDALRGSCQRDDRLIHFGRNSTYGLKIWEKEGKVKGGTMHDISEEYLLQFDTPIHIEELVKYVKQYRENTTNKRLLYNLKSAENRRFIFFKNSYVGSVKKNYDENWIILNNKNSRKSWEENYSELLALCKEINRQPLLTNENESKLYRFLNVQRSKLDKLPRKKREKIEYILKNYPKIRSKRRKK